MRTIAVAAEGKGRLNLVRRAGVIGSRYGLRPHRMDRRLDTVLRLTQRYRCSATLPVTAAAFDRHPGVITRYAELGIEFAVHGYRHVDHVGLPASDQIEQLGRARRLLEGRGLDVTGFRAPYLRWDPSTLLALRENGYLYDSSQAMHWPIDPELETEDYLRGLGFYTSLSATEHPVLPRVEDGIVRIPCCLPDDESVLDRMRLTPEAIADLWVGIQQRTYERGELFTMQVHPERIEPCAPGIEAVLSAARAARPGVWVARLDQIAHWWLERTATIVSVREDGGGRLHVRVDGPEGLTILVRNLDGPKIEPWFDGYGRIAATRFDVQTDRRPFVGVHPGSAGALTAFLREQGYVVEIGDSPGAYAHFLSRPSFTPADARPLLAELEDNPFPLMRLGRWPDGARSAVALTGDVDALTIRDYALRFVGR